MGDDKITIRDNDGKTLGTLKKVLRKQPRGKPPAGAIVLFDGTSADHFINGRMTADGLLKEGPTSKEKFQNATLHVEFQLSFMPTARGQARANSGVYLQGATRCRCSIRSVSRERRTSAGRSTACASRG